LIPGPEQAPRFVARSVDASEIFGRGQIGARRFGDRLGPVDVDQRAVTTSDLFGRRKKNRTWLSQSKFGTEQMHVVPGFQHSIAARSCSTCSITSQQTNASYVAL
jgi:hypothetical protein